MSDLVEVIKREEFFCSRTRTKRKRNGGYFMVPVDEAIKGIEAGDYKARKHPCGVVPKEWRKSPVRVVKPKTEDKGKSAEVKE